MLRLASPTPRRRRTFQSCERQGRRSLSVEKFDILRRALAAAMYGYICEPIGLGPSTRTHREPLRNDSGFMSPWKSTYTPHHERDQGSLPDGKSQRPAPIHPPARPLAFKFINHTYTSQSGFGPPHSVRTSARVPSGPYYAYFSRLIVMRQRTLRTSRAFSGPSSPSLPMAPAPF